MLMRILFCDDNALILSQLQQYVSAFFLSIGGYLPEFASYISGEDLLQNETKADIAFLDIEMAGISGIHVGAKLKEHNPRIKIFIVTSFPDYLDEAMRFHVFRYLSKPIDKNRLFRNLKDAVYQYNMETTEYPIITNDEIKVYKSDEIVCIEASQRKVLVYTINEVIRSAKNMEYWRTTLTLPCFFSAHRSYIINMRYVSIITRDTITLKYAGIQKDVFLARRRYTHLKDRYLLYLESTK